MLGVSAFGINITNYPATNAFDGSMTFLLSKASAATNFNIQADLIASTNWAIGTFLPASGNAVSSTYVTTSPLTNHVNIANVDTPGAIVTNQNAWSVNLATNLTVGGASNVLSVTVAASSSNTNNVIINAGSANTLVVTNGKVGIGGQPVTASQIMSVGGRVGISGSIDMASSAYYLVLNSEYIRSDASGRYEISAGGAAPFLYLSSAVAGTSVFPGNIMATNGVQLMVKPSFTTNFTCTTNLQVYLCNGTNQIVTLPNAAYVPNVVYRFAMTNGYARVIITNATGAQTIRDGTSLSFTQIGIGSPSFFSDGAHWWPAARTRVIMPNAQFSCSTNIPLTSANTAYPVTFNSTDFNNSQGIALALGTNGTHFSKMWITNSGQYEFTPSIVIGMGNVSHTVRYWFRSNDTNIPASTTPTKVAGNDVVVVTVPFVVNITTPTAIEIWAESDGVNDALTAGAASGNYPAAPSVICPVKRISDTWP